MDLATLDQTPLPAVFLAMMAVTLAAIAAGFWVGRRHRQSDESSGSIGAVVAATSGLVAFLLAFTFSGAASRFDLRKELLLEEVNAIGTTYLRAALLAEPYRTNARKLLREYVDVRVGITVEGKDLAKGLERTIGIQDELWNDVVALTALDRDSTIDALYVASLNDVIDFHTRRTTVALQYRVPASIWTFLLLVTVLAMGTVGYDFGVSGSRRYRVTLILALTFSSVIVLIADLDRPGQGFLKVNQQPMLDLQQQMKAGASP